MRSSSLLLLAAALVPLYCTAQPTEAPKKFPQPGSTVPGSFSPLIINGPWKEEDTKKDEEAKPIYRHHSVVAGFGLKPVVLVFARDYKDETVADFLKKLEAKVEAYQDQELRASAIFLCHDDKRDKNLPTKELIEVTNEQETIIAKLQENLPGLKRVLVGIDAPGGPKGYAVGERAYVTVILYDKYKVKKAYVYDIGDAENKESSFNAKAAGSALKAIDEWMASLKSPAAAPKK
jgi:hypothetical protein